MEGKAAASAEHKQIQNCTDGYQLKGSPPHLSSCRYSCNSSELAASAPRASAIEGSCMREGSKD